VIWQQQHPELGMETLKAIRKDIQVLADIRTNSLIITAPIESMALMEGLVKAVDLPPDAAKIRVFQLRNADAEQMIDMLEQLFERQTAGGSRGGSSGETERELVLAEGLASGGRQEIAFTADVRTNSVIAAGTPGYLDLVEELVLELDTQAIKPRVTLVYAPKNNTAQAIADSLSKFSDAEQQRLQEIGDAVSVSARQEREITVIPNEDANRILIDVDPRFKDTVMQVIQDLDEPPPQVVIQVLILEVTMDNELDLGVEFAFQDLQWSKAGPGDTTTFDYVGGTDLGAAGSGLGGFTFTISGADFNFLFRTLQNEGSLRVLSRPQITAMDNQEARIDIVDDVPYVSSTQTSSTGQISTGVSRADIGITLEVTPQINPDGFVRMEVRQEASQQTGSTVDVGQGVTSPVFFRREAETTITVRDNETVVLGGLITSTMDNREQKVPIIGDIPGLGMLFRNQNDQFRRTELLIVLTPHVVRTVDDMRRISVIERDRLETISQDVLQNELMQGLQKKDDELLSDEAFQAEPADPADREALEPREEEYGPLRPALRTRPEPVTDEDSYNVPVTMRSAARR
jgi:type II secretion system protein D